MFWSTIGNALLIFFLRITDVSMGTVRTTMIVRGMRKWAVLIGFVEVTIWVLAISRVISNLNTFWSVLGYSGGFAAGTMLGMWIEGKLALGYSNMNIISMNKGPQIAEKVRKAGYGATQVRAEGQSGPVHLVNVIAPRKQVPEIIRLVNQVDATCFVTVEDARQVLRGHRRLAK